MQTRCESISWASTKCVGAHLSILLNSGLSFDVCIYVHTYYICYLGLTCMAHTYPSCTSATTTTTAIIEKTTIGSALWQMFATFQVPRLMQLRCSGRRRRLFNHLSKCDQSTWANNLRVGFHGGNPMASDGLCLMPVLANVETGASHELAAGFAQFC